MVLRVPITRPVAYFSVTYRRKLYERLFTIGKWYIWVGTSIWNITHPALYYNINYINVFGISIFLYVLKSVYYSHQIGGVWG